MSRTNVLIRSELSKDNITKPIREKKKRSCDWQRTPAANDRHIRVSHVKSGVSFYLERYSEGVGRWLDCCNALHCWEPFRLYQCRTFH